MKKLDLKVGDLCNNNCIFCIQAKRNEGRYRSFESIISDLKQGALLGCEEVVMTGGEPTIRKDFFEILQTAKAAGYSKIIVQTNGRMFSYGDFCKRAADCGLSEAVVSFHGFCKEQQESLTRAEGSFSQAVAGIKNILNFKILLGTNTVIVKQNYQNLPEIVSLLTKLGVNSIRLSVVHPRANALINFNEVVPLLSEIAPYVEKAIKIAENMKVKITIEGMPVCIMPNYEKYVCEIISNIIVRGMNQDTNNFKQIRDQQRVKTDKCINCKKNSVCEGAWKEYVGVFGDGDLAPI